MNINKYLEKHHLTQLEFAFRLKVTERTVYKWRIGIKPRKKMAKKIVKATHGEVTLDELGH